MDSCIIKRYHQYCDKILEDEIKPLIRKHFKYNVNDYMNHLKSRSKQEEVLEFYNDYVNNNIKDSHKLRNHATKYTLFSKEEKQILEYDVNGNPSLS